MKWTHILGIILAIALTAFGVLFPVPEKHIRVNSYDYDNPWTDSYGETYVGGDAYNYQIEASLKAGYMSGILAMKSITFVGGLLLFFITLYSIVRYAAIEEQMCVISNMVKSAESCRKVLEKLSNIADGQQTILNAVSTNLEKCISSNEENIVEKELVQDGR